MPERADPGAPSPARHPLDVLARPLAWCVLVVVVVVVLALGSVHPRPSNAAQRLARLESVIKCPSCEDVSIAQSTSQSALALRAEVRLLVGEGWSDARIEAWVTTTYGPSELLEPSDALAWVLPIAACGVAACSLAGFFVVRRRRRGDSALVASDEALVADALVRDDEGATLPR